MKVIKTDISEVGPLLWVDAWHRWGTELVNAGVVELGCCLERPRLA